MLRGEVSTLSLCSLYKLSDEYLEKLDKTEEMIIPSSEDLTYLGDIVGRQEIYTDYTKDEDLEIKLDRVFDSINKPVSIVDKIPVYKNIKTLRITPMFVTLKEGPFVEGSDGYNYLREYTKKQNRLVESIDDEYRRINKLLKDIKTRKEPSSEVPYRTR